MLFFIIQCSKFPNKTLIGMTQWVLLHENEFTIFVAYDVTTKMYPKFQVGLEQVPGANNCS